MRRLLSAAVALAATCAGVWLMILVGSIHVLFALVFVLYPSDMSARSLSPAIGVLTGLHGTDSMLATGALVFVGYGVSILVGCALLAVGLGAPASAHRAPASAAVTVLSAAGGVLAIGAALWALAAAGPFYRATLQFGRWEPLAAAFLVVAALAFGALLVLSGRSPAGAWIAGGALSLAGLALLIPFPGAPSMLPLQFGQQLLTIGWSGMILALGLAVLGLALGVSLRPRSAPVPPAAYASAPYPPAPYAGPTAPGSM